MRRQNREMTIDMLFQHSPHAQISAILSGPRRWAKRSLYGDEVDLYLIAKRVYARLQCRNASRWINVKYVRSGDTWE